MSEEWREVPLGSCYDLVAERYDSKNLPPEATYFGLEHLDSAVPVAVTGGKVADVSGQVTAFRPTDTLFGRLRPYLRKVSYSAVDAYGSTEILVLRPRVDVVHPRFLHLLASSDTVISEAVAKSAGSRMPRTSAADLAAITVALPPLSVQRRIVDLMEHLDNQVNALSGQELAAADLACQLRRETFVKLAESRPLVRVDTMFDMLLGRQKSARQSVGDYVYPYIRAANIGTQGWRLDDLQTMNFDPREQAKYGVHEDDVLLVEGGSIGGVQRWSGEIGGFVGFDKHVIRLRATADRSTSEYALQWCHWSRESGAFEEQATGITIKALGFGRASAMPIPDISLAEQVEMMTPLAAADDVTVGLRTEILKLTDLRTALLTLLLDGSREVPESYHELLGVAS